jgi:hypothetical protein
MFAALGLATDDDRRRYTSLANVGVVGVVEAEKTPPVRCDGGTEDAAGERQTNAQLP